MRNIRGLFGTEIRRFFWKKDNNEKKHRPLKWSMILMLFFGWFLPLIVMMIIIGNIVSASVNRQIISTVEASGEKAIEICALRLEDCVTASKNASYLPTIKKANQDYKKTGDRQKLYNDITLFLKQQYKYNENFKSAELFFTDRNYDVFFTYNNSTNSSYVNVRDFKNNALPEISAISRTLGTDTMIVSFGGRTYLVRNLVDSSFNPYAVLSLELNSDKVFDSIESIWGYADREIYDDGKLIAGADDSGEFASINDKIYEIARTGKTSFYSDNDNPFLIGQLKTGNGNIITIVTALDENVVYAEHKTVLYLVLIIAIFMFPLIGIIFHFFSRKVTDPLADITAVTRRIENGEYGVLLTQKASSMEINDLGNAFDSMSSQLKAQFDQIYSEELALRDARIMALQSQINPHFLNNTLEIINWEARLKENYKVSGMIEALSTMLEATMNRRTESEISLSEEMSYVDAYLFIISQRFGDRFELKKDIDESLFEYKVPRLIIQPIVENAIEHGMDVSKTGKVSIKIFTLQEALFIEIRDNGQMTRQDKEKVDMLLNGNPDPNKEKRVSLGIRNVNRRIKIMYGDEYGLTITSTDNGNTVSTIKLKCIL